MSESEDLDNYLERMLKEHRELNVEARRDGDKEMENRAYYMHYAFHMVKEYLFRHRRGEDVMTKDDGAIAGLKDK